MATQGIENPLPPPAPTPTPAEKRSWLDAVQSLASITVTALFIIVFVVQAFRIPSGSMEDTLLVGDYLLVDKFAYAPGGYWHWIVPYKRLERGDILVFKWPVHPDQHFVKRIVGLPGDRIHLAGGRVFVNGVPLSESYAVHKHYNHDFFRDDFPARPGNDANIDPRWAADIAGFTRNREIIVPEDSYFVLGDNRDSSLDSRYWGFVPRENIVGKPLLIYFSVRPSDDEPELHLRADDKMTRFADDVRRLPTIPRWSRMLHFVK